MFFGLITLLCCALAFPLHTLLAGALPRRFATLRPNLIWLTSGLISLMFFSITGLTLSASPLLLMLRPSAFVYGVGAIAFFAHRRVYFRKNGAYEYRFGVPVRACRYASVAHCEAGKDVIREGLLLRLKSGAAWGVPGLMPEQQIAEALWLLQRAGLEIPGEDELRARLGMDYGHIRTAQPMRP
ncbi:MAG: hypothetical protein AAFO88_02860 [Pseudomonadota bacterium]